MPPLLPKPFTPLLPSPFQYLVLRLLTTTTTASPLPSSSSSFHPPQTQNPYDLMTADPVDIVSSLWIHCYAKTPNRTCLPIPNLTGYLKRFDLWVFAYQRACAHYAGTFPSKVSIHHHQIQSLLSLSHRVLSGSFLWGNSAHQLLRSPNSGSAPKQKVLDGIADPSDGLFQDRVVQEVLLLLVEPVFEPRFSSKSHGFRPGRSAHTVIRTVRSNFAGYLWFVKCDLSAVFDKLDVGFLMSCLKKGLKDKKVLNLIRSAYKSPVKAGLDVSGCTKEGIGKLKLKNKRLKRKAMRMVRRKKVLKEDEPKPDPYWLRVFYSFAPEEAAKIPHYGHCGILSPLLANICLNEFDAWMEGKIVAYFCPSKLDSIWKDSMTDGCHNPSWPEFVPTSGRDKTRRMDFIRYGMHVLIGIRGPREDAVKLRSELIDFCENIYGIKLENAKVEIEHITRGIHFLDHIICRRVIYPTLRYTSTGGKIVSQKGVGTLLSVTANLQRCVSQFRKLDLVKGDKDPEPLPCVAMFYSGQAHTNAQMNKFLETMADWYRYADNRKKVVGFCAYVIRSSLAKLYAARYRLKSRAKVYKIASRDLSQPLIEHTRNDVPEYSDLLRMGLVDTIDGVQFSQMSQIPSCDYTPFPRNWIPQHERLLKDYIQLQDTKFFCELYKAVKLQEISLPQDDMSKIVWDCKIHGVRSCQFHENMKKMEYLPMRLTPDSKSSVTM